MYVIYSDYPFGIFKLFLSCIFATVEPEVTSSTFKSRRKVNSQNYIIYNFPLVVTRRKPSDEGNRNHLLKYNTDICTTTITIDLITGVL